MSFDYEKLGLIVGLECHQQLDTGKLFCRCPSVPAEHIDKVFKRKLRIAASELNKLDPAMVEQFKKDYVYIYNASNACNCLIEADEEPVRPVDEQALDTTLKIALMCNSKIFDELFVMRKIVIDGSNVSGFQRTILVAEGGLIELNKKNVHISTIVLEEDAAVAKEKSNESISYNLQRLGIPLIELATAPELHSPEEVKECALKIGEIFRRTCSVKRGLGTIRQDINISIKEGARVELKGIQDIDLVDAFVENEVARQVALIEIKKELEKRNFLAEELQNAEIKDLSGLLKNCESNIVKKAIKSGKSVFGIRLKKFAGLLGKNLQGKRRFGTELANYLKVKHKIAGLLHSDELPNYGITEEEKKQIAEMLSCGTEDAFVLLCESRHNAEQAFDTIIQRCCAAINGVPEETRNVLKDGCSEYLRPLPGSARMYPETDLESISIEKNRLQKLKKEIPLTVNERETLYRKHGLSEKLISKMKLDNKACFFEKMLKKGFNATTTAVVLLEDLTRLERETGKQISDEKIEELLELHNKGEIMKDLLYEMLLEIAKNPEISLKELVKKKKACKISLTEAEQKIAEIVKRNAELVKEKKEYAMSALMGEAMKELRGKLSGKEVSDLLLKEIRKRL